MAARMKRDGRVRAGGRLRPPVVEWRKFLRFRCDRKQGWASPPLRTNARVETLQLWRLVASSSVRKSVSGKLPREHVIVNDRRGRQDVSDIDIQNAVSHSLIQVQNLEIYIEFGRLVKQSRLRLKLTQGDLAKRVGMSRTSITNIELGYQKILLHQVFLIAEALNIEVSYLLPSLPDSGSISDLEHRFPKGLARDEADFIQSVVRSHRGARRR